MRRAYSFRRRGTELDDGEAATAGPWRILGEIFAEYTDGGVKA